MIEIMHEVKVWASAHQDLSGSSTAEYPTFEKQRPKLIPLNDPLLVPSNRLIKANYIALHRGGCWKAMLHGISICLIKTLLQDYLSRMLP